MTTEQQRFRERFGARLKAMRAALYDTPEEFALALRVAGVEARRKQVTRWEDGSLLPALDKLPAVARVLGVGVRELIPEESTEKG